MMRDWVVISRGGGSGNCSPFGFIEDSIIIGRNDEGYYPVWPWI